VTSKAAPDGEDEVDRKADEPDGEDEVDRKADEFIAKFREQIRRQRLLACNDRCMPCRVPCTQQITYIYTIYSSTCWSVMITSCFLYHCLGASVQLAAGNTVYMNEKKNVVAVHVLPLLLWQPEVQHFSFFSLDLLLPALAKIYDELHKFLNKKAFFRTRARPNPIHLHTLPALAKI
jgi:hypothetical protein